MNTLIKTFLVLFLGLSIPVSFAQDSTSQKNHQHHMDMKDNMNDQDSMKHGMMDHNVMHHTMKDTTKTGKMNEDSIVREGIIDLQAIDENEDGNVFQDMMDWNVISDEAGRCPLCNMKLKEVSLEKAEKNLIENDFKVKVK